MDSLVRSKVVFRRDIKRKWSIKRRRLVERRRLVRRVSIARGKLIILRSSVEQRWQVNTVRRVRLQVIKRWLITIIMSQRGVIAARRSSRGGENRS